MHGHDGDLVPVLGLVIVLIGQQGYIFEVINQGGCFVFIDRRFGKFLDTIQQFLQVFIPAAFFGCISIIKVFPDTGGDGNMLYGFKCIQFGGL